MRTEPSGTGLVPLQKGPQRAPLPLHHVRTQSMNQEQVRTRHQIRQHLDLGFPGLQNDEK